MDALISIVLLGHKVSCCVVQFFSSHSKTINGKVLGFHNLYTKRSNQKALQFWRMENSLKHEKPAKSVLIDKRQAPKARGPEHLPGLPNG